MKARTLIITTGAILALVAPAAQAATSKNGLHGRTAKAQLNAFRRSE